MYRVKLLFILAFSAATFLLAGSGFKPEPAQFQVKGGISKPEVFLGEPFEFILTIRGPKTATFQWNNESYRQQDKELGSFIMLDKPLKTVLEQEDIKEEVTIFKLVAYDLGKLEIPEFQVLLKEAEGADQVEKAGPFTVKIVSGFKQDKPPQLIDIAPQRQIYYKNYLPLYILAAILTGLLLFFLIRRIIKNNRGQKRKKTKKEEKPFILPHLKALQKLQLIITQNLLTRGMYREYFDAISDTVREYLGALYQLDALEMTSTELLFTLSARPTPGLDYHKTQFLLFESDMVKFAKNIPSQQTCSQVLDYAFNIVESTRSNFEKTVTRVEAKR